MDDWGSPVETSWAPIDVGPAGERDGPAPSCRRARLADILKRELLPHLVDARVKATPVSKGEAVAPSDADALARCLVSGKLEAVRAAIAARLASGASAQAIMFEDIAPAARRLGEYWRDDDCDFADVTIAAAALRNILRDAAPDEPGPRWIDAPSLMVSTAPGETHELGADIVSSVFRRAGWRTVRCASDEALAALQREWFDVAGFSLSCDRYVDALRRAIGKAREVSRNRRLAILVGGPVFASDPKLAARMGADACASDVDVAPQFPSTIQRALLL